MGPRDLENGAGPCDAGLGGGRAEATEGDPAGGSGEGSFSRARDGRQSTPCVSDPSSTGPLQVHPRDDQIPRANRAGSCPKCCPRLDEEIRGLDICDLTL